MARHDVAARALRAASECHAIPEYVSDRMETRKSRKGSASARTLSISLHIIQKPAHEAVQTPFKIRSLTYPSIISKVQLKPSSSNAHTPDTKYTEGRFLRPMTTLSDTSPTTSKPLSASPNLALLVDTSTQALSSFAKFLYSSSSNFSPSSEFGVVARAELLLLLAFCKAASDKARRARCRKRVARGA
jgi:hypothetical protein